jgi:hypothetical protein
MMYGFGFGGLWMLIAWLVPVIAVAALVAAVAKSKA